jgi:GNAT superfamily N-acetyltransferase
MNEIRYATPADVPAIAVLSGQLGYPMSELEAGERLEAIGQRPDHAVLVADAGSGQVVGWIHVFGTYPLMEPPTAEIGGLIVGDSHRSAGLGQTLVEAGEAWARAAGFCGMRVHSNVVRTRAHTFYERLGYRCTKTQGHLVKALR